MRRIMFLFIISIVLIGCSSNSIPNSNPTLSFHQFSEEEGHLLKLIGQDIKPIIFDYINVNDFSVVNITLELYDDKKSSQNNLVLRRDVNEFGNLSFLVDSFTGDIVLSCGKYEQNGSIRGSMPGYNEDTYSYEVLYVSEDVAINLDEEMLLGLILIMKEDEIDYKINSLKSVEELSSYIKKCDLNDYDYVYMLKCKFEN